MCSGDDRGTSGRAILYPVNIPILYCRILDLGQNRFAAMAEAEVARLISWRSAMSEAAGVVSGLADKEKRWQTRTRAKIDLDPLDP